MVDYYSSVYMYRIFFIHSSVYGHLGCLHVLAIVNSAAISIVGHISFQIILFLTKALWRTVWIYLIKLKIELPWDAAYPLLVVYPK